MPFAGHEVAYTAPFVRDLANKTAFGATIEVMRGTDLVARLEPRLNDYDSGQTVASPAVHTGWRGDFYVSLASWDEDGAIALDLYWFPYIWLVWVGGFTTALGGAFAWLMRRRAASVPQPGGRRPPVSETCAAGRRGGHGGSGRRRRGRHDHRGRDGRRPGAGPGARIKCPVCQGESIAESPSETSTAMLAVVAEKVAAGESDDQIIQYFTDRYGSGILLDPPFRGRTLALWLTPLAALAAGVALILGCGAGAPPRAASAEEEGR